MSATNPNPSPDDADIEAEFAVLNSEAGASALDEAAGIVRIGPSEIERWRKRLGSAQGAAVLRIARGRRQAAAKFSRSRSMWLDPVGAEQSTSETVADRKAERLARLARASGIEEALDLCSGIGGDAIALARRLPTVAIDRSQALCRRLLWNAEVYGVGDRLLAVRGRAETFVVPRSRRVAVHIDPDRRACDRDSSGPSRQSPRRARRIDDYAPGLDFLRDLMSRAAGCAVKLSPASDFETAFAAPGLEIELTSLDGECKEVVVWSGAFAECRRRAVSLPSGAVWTDRDGPSDARAAVASWKRWVYEPDPALTRAGLLDGFAERFGLARAAAGLPLLTTDDPLPEPSPWLAEFEILDVLSADMKRLRAAVASHPASALDVKPRGVAATPETLRPDLRFTPIPDAPPLVLFLVRGDDGRRSAALARRKEGRALRRLEAK